MLVLAATGPGVGQASLLTFALLPGLTHTPARDHGWERNVRTAWSHPGGSWTGMHAAFCESWGPREWTDTNCPKGDVCRTRKEDTRSRSSESLGSFGAVLPSGSRGGRESRTVKQTHQDLEQFSGPRCCFLLNLPGSLLSFSRIGFLLLIVTQYFYCILLCSRT